MKSKKLLICIISALCLVGIIIVVILAKKETFLVKPLNDRDFAVTDGIGYVYLDCPADKFLKQFKEKEINFFSCK